MKLLLKQESKELMTADFQLLKDNSVIGNINIKGTLISMDVKINGTILEKPFQMLAKRREKGQFRPYKILVNGNELGAVYQKDIKTGFFTTKAYKECTYNHKVYSMYSNFINKKSIHSVYLNDMQLAQYEYGNTIYNELYEYEIYCKDMENIMEILAFILHDYLISGFKAGEQPTKSVRTFTMSKNDWEDKYDPNWLDSISN